MTTARSKVDKRLLGTWRSDRARTVAEWRFAKRLSPEKRKIFLSIFGKLRLTYTRKRIRGVLQKYQFAQPYEVLAADSDTVALRYYDSQLTKEWRIQHLHFTGPDRLWISCGRNREWFRRI